MSLEGPKFGGRTWLTNDASIAQNEEAAKKHAKHASTIDEAAFIRAIKEHPPHPGRIDRTHMIAAQQNGCANLDNWRAGQKLDENNPVVLFDVKNRLAAIGWPHTDLTYTFERMPNDQVIVHEHHTCIVREGMWTMLQIIVSLNNEDSWGTQPGMSVTGMFQQLEQIQNRFGQAGSASYASP